MLRVALILLIALSALPFAAVVPGPAAVQSDVRAAMVSPAVRSEATATVSAAARPPSPTASVAAQPSHAPMTVRGAVTTTQLADGVAASPIPTASPTAPGAVAVDGGTGASIAQDAPTAQATVGVSGATATPIPSAAPTATGTVASALPVPTPPTTLNSVEQIIATRGDHLLHHDINLPSPLGGYSFGQHGTEDNKSLPGGAGSVNLWLGVSRDVSQLDTALGVKVNIRNIRGYVYKASTRTWEQIFSGLPTWMVSVDNVPPFSYYDIAPTHEADGSYSFDVPPGRGLHMSSPAPGLAISEANGVLCIVEARLLGPDAVTAKLGMAAGADYRDGAGSGGSIQQSGFGQLGLLTGNWKAFDMLSSTLTDDQLRLNPPPMVR
jgi:hypothetical protein